MRWPRFTFQHGGRDDRSLSHRDLRLGAVVFLAVFVAGLLLTSPARPDFGATSQNASAPSRDNAAAGARGASPGRVRVIDGDTVELPETREIVRIANIDTPESGARAGCPAEDRAAAAAGAALAALIGRAGRVDVDRSGRVDRYGRTIARIRVDGRDVGELMVEGRHARVWRGRREPWCASDGTLSR